MDYRDFTLNDREFARIRARILRTAGISLSDAKRTLVISRLGKVIRRLGLSGFSAYADFLEGAATRDDEQEFVNALTTNLTRFYREDHHFDHLCGHVDELMATRPRKSMDNRPRLRIWSAGCSTGQEAYTIGMALTARFPELERWDFRILATDIDTRVVATAIRGIYPERELAGLAPERAIRFERTPDGQVRVPQNVRSLVVFKPLNLAGPWPMRGPFDAIFCRNVAIYFDKATQARLFARLGEMLAPGGYLYVGHSESIATGGDRFALEGKTIYRLTGRATSRDAA